VKKWRITPGSIKGKLIFYFGTAVSLVVLLIVVVFSHSMYISLIEDNDQLIRTHTQDIANRIELGNLEAVTIAKTMALAQKSGLFGKREASTKYALNVLTENPGFTGSYFGYEPNADQDDAAYLEKAGNGAKGLSKSGRFLPYWFVDGNEKGKFKLNPLVDMETSLYYQGSKEKFLSDNKEKHMITEPYFYEGKMIVEQSFPIVVNGKFVGIAGVDRALTEIHAYLQSLKPYKSASFVLLSRKGRIISSTMDLVSKKTFNQFQQTAEGDGKDAETGIDRHMMTQNIEETDYKNLLHLFYKHSGPPLLIRQTDPLDGKTYIFSGAKIETGDWTIVMRVSEGEITAPIRNTLVKVLLISFIGLFITFMILIWIAKRISGPISEAVDIAKEVADGDFTAEVKIRSSDETGHLLSALDTMTDNLNSLVGQVQLSSIQVTSSSTELAATAREQETTMSNQLESTDRVVKSVENISHVATDLVETMQRVASMSQETAVFASSGQKDLSKMEEAMRSMETASKSISGRLASINEKAGNISHVVDTITKVADQTNLLSLNAAIEAEKAGEYGRGFQVVAREIRRLADQTAVATLDIEQMVQEMESAVASGVMEMEKFIDEVRRSAEDVGNISTQLTRIIAQVQAQSPSFEELNVATGHQSESARKINTAMVNLSEGLQESIESLRETYAAIGQLNEATKTLQEEISRFTFRQ